MARWYSEHPEYTEISKEEFDLREKIVKIMKAHVCEMEGYSYFGSNPGISEDDLDDVADDIMSNFRINTK